MSLAENDYSLLWNSSSLAENEEEGGYTLIRNIFVIIVYGTIITVTIIGNLMVILAFRRDHRINSKIANWYIVNLSIADFTVGLVSMTINLAWLLTDDWPLGEIPCKIYLLVDYVVTNVPVCTIIFISLDRYWLLTKKLEYPKYQTKTKAKIFIISMWVFCILFFSVITFAWIPITGLEEEIEYDWNCELEATYNFEFQLFMIALFFVFPLATIACLNFIVYRNIRERSKGFVQSKPVVSAVINKPPVPHPNSSTPAHENKDITGTNSGLEKGTSDISLISLSVENNGSTRNSSRPEKPPVDKKQKEFNRHRKAAVTLAVLVSVFILCWLPFYIASLLGTICEECVPELAWEITSNLLWCNSTVNPFLYAAMNMHFRLNFIRFLGLKRCLKKRPEPTSSFTDE